LNTVVRPPSETTVRRVPAALLTEFAVAFTPEAEVIAGVPELHADQRATADDVLALIARRPCTVADVAAGLAIHPGTALKALSALVERGEAERREHGGVFYTAAHSTRPWEEES
jgi:predicted Rossmann fold nucleotide-binding protein DprA/Smf involved in DNA uptake